jgi:hypothetical protein
MVTLFLALSNSYALPPQIETRARSSMRNDIDHKVVTVDCPPGFYAIGGGGTIVEDAYQGQISWSGPTPGRPIGTSWSVAGDETYDPGGGAWGIQAVATCVNRTVWSALRTKEITGRVGAGVSEVTATCPAGTKVISGGLALTDPANGFSRMLASTPSGTDTWRATFLAIEDTDFSVTAICAPTPFWNVHFSQVVLQSGAGEDYQVLFMTCPSGFPVSTGAEISGPEATEAVFYGIDGGPDFAYADASIQPFGGGMDWRLTLTGTCYAP